MNVLTSWDTAARRTHVRASIRHQASADQSSTSIKLRTNMQPEVEKPLFLVGTGRCGSTALHRLLTRHSELAWLSHYIKQYPERPTLNMLAMTLLDTPIVAAMTRRIARPAEAYEFWDRYFRGFSSPCRDLLSEDVPPRGKMQLRKAMARTLTRRRGRLLAKITGWPRIGFLKEVFPDAKFVHVHRDGRAVASSLLQMSWWGGWGGPGNWKWGDLTAEQRSKWERHRKSFVVLAGIQWEILMESFQRARTSVPATDVLEVSYEELCRNKLENLRRIAEFANLSWTADYERVVEAFPFVNTNHKWREYLSDVQQRELEDALSDSLARYGYTVDSPSGQDVGRQPQA